MILLIQLRKRFYLQKATEVVPYYRPEKHLTYHAISFCCPQILFPGEEHKLREIWFIYICKVVILTEMKLNSNKCFKLNEKGISQSPKESLELLSFLGGMYLFSYMSLWLIRISSAEPMSLCHHISLTT